jgi:hypothetical protein
MAEHTQSPSDADIERRLRAAALKDPIRGAEVLLRWQQCPRPPEPVRGVDLQGMSDEQLEALRARLLELVQRPEHEPEALVAYLMGHEKGGSADTSPDST